MFSAGYILIYSIISFRNIFTRNEIGLKLGLKTLFSWVRVSFRSFRGVLDPKTRFLDPAKSDHVRGLKYEV